MNSSPVIAVTGLHRGENPQPGSSVIRSLRRDGARTVILPALRGLAGRIRASAVATARPRKIPALRA